MVHVRDAGQAKPHLEHNPLSLLEAWYATPKRKLNDPGQAWPPLAPYTLMPHNGLAIITEDIQREDERYGARNTDTATSGWGRGRRLGRVGAGRLMALA